ncbi:MAG: EamA family transporter [Alphaproteobacteria bacterium]|nr:EamA family transporter [Alphaproteobacteria bacterium]
MLLAFFPFFAAALYGLSYVLIERITAQVNLTTYYLASNIIWLACALAHGYIRKEPFSFGTAENVPNVLLLILIASAAGSIAWLFTTYALKNISASYAAFGEISYPIFTLLFAALLFGLRGFSWQHMVGGALIFAGSIILVMAQSEAGKH